MNPDQAPWMNEELALFRDNVRKFIAAEITPFEEEWDAQQFVDRALSVSYTHLTLPTIYSV